MPQPTDGSLRGSRKQGISSSGAAHHTQLSCLLMGDQMRGSSSSGGAAQQILRHPACLLPTCHTTSVALQQPTATPAALTGSRPRSCGGGPTLQRWSQICLASQGSTAMTGAAWLALPT